MVLDRIKKLFRGEHQLQLTEIQSFYQQHRQEKLEQLDQQIETFYQDIGSIINSLREQAESLKNYNDPDSPAVINDVVRNIAQQREKLANSFHTPKNPEKLLDNVSNFIQNFQTLTVKEREVIKHAGEEVDSLFTRLKHLQEHEKQLKTFIDNQYSSKTTYNQIKKLQNKIKALEEEIKEHKDFLESDSISQAEKSVEEAEKELEKLKNNDQWDRLKTLQQKKEQLEQEKDRQLASTGDPVSRMERGLKKLLYQARNSDLELATSDIEKIETLKDHGPEQVDDLDQLLTKIKELVNNTDILDGRYQDSFLTALQETAQLPEKRVEIEKLKKKIQELSQGIKNFPLKKQRTQLQEQLRQQKRKLEEVEEQAEQTRKSIREKKKEIHGLVGEIEQLMNQEFRDRIELVFEHEE